VLAYFFDFFFFTATSPLPPMINTKHVSFTPLTCRARRPSVGRRNTGSPKPCPTAASCCGVRYSRGDGVNARPTKCAAPQQLNCGRRAAEAATGKPRRRRRRRRSKSHRNDDDVASTMVIKVTTVGLPPGFARVYSFFSSCLQYYG
jgi:hypothetical protein